ncbi:hypothetical protein ONZ51_g8708 [Trametes cubensis]|uniref:Uncharacterized protein n=1 Tax=Trametes cubensis TaxID=1111947 RepID=A0AAD7TQ76_9APHY|nr:hypothetical protein ONZ51_g8708 [Trametes cubensis]
MTSQADDNFDLQFANKKLSGLYDLGSKSPTAGATKGFVCANLLNRAEIGVEPEPGDTNTSPIVFEVEFGRPKLFTAVKASKYKLQLRIAAFRSPKEYGQQTADCTVDVRYESEQVNKSKSQFGGFSQILKLQEADVVEINRLDEDKVVIDKNNATLCKIVKKYLHELHKAGLHGLLANAVFYDPLPPVTGKKIPKPEVPVKESTLFSNYFRMLWILHRDKLATFKSAETAEGSDYMLTFNRPPQVVVFGEQDQKVWLIFDGVAVTDSNSSSDRPSGPNPLPMPTLLFGSSTKGDDIIRHTGDSDRRSLRKDIQFTCNNPGGDTIKPFVIEIMEKSYIPKLLREYGFDTLYPSVDWNKLREALDSEDKGSSSKPYGLGELDMVGKDCVVIVPQTSIRAGITAVCKEVTHVKLVDKEEVILWVRIPMGDIIETVAHAETDVYYAFKAALKLRSRNELYLDTTVLSFQHRVSVVPATLNADELNTLPVRLRSIEARLRAWGGEWEERVDGGGDAKGELLSRAFALCISRSLSEVDILNSSSRASPRSGDQALHLPDYMIVTKDAFVDHVLLPQLARVSDRIIRALASVSSTQVDDNLLRDVPVAKWTRPTGYDGAPSKDLYRYQTDLDIRYAIRGTLVSEAATEKLVLHSSIHIPPPRADLKEVLVVMDMDQGGPEPKETLRVFRVAQNDVTFCKLSDSLLQSDATAQVSGDTIDKTIHTGQENKLQHAFRKYLKAYGDSPLVDLQAVAFPYSFHDVQGVELNAKGNFVLVFKPIPRGGADAALKPSAGNSKLNGGPVNGEKPTDEETANDSKPSMN